MPTTLARLDFWLRTAMGPAVAGAQVYIVAQPANIVNPPSPLIALFADNKGITPLVQPLIADGLGHVSAYAQSQLYTLVVVVGGVIQNSYTDQFFPDINGTEVLPPSGTGQVVVTTSPAFETAPAGDVATTDGAGNVQDSSILLSSLAPKANASLTGITTIATANITTANITNANGVLNALDFPGTDIGAKVNAAIAALGTTGGEIYIPAGTYNQSTTIYLPPWIKLRGASATGTILTWTPTTGWAIVVAGNNTGLFNNFSYQGALEDLTLTGPGYATSTGAVYVGGSDGVAGSPSTILDPSTNEAWQFNFNRVRIVQTSSAGTFGIGYQLGYNAWSINWLECTINGTGTAGIYLPDGLGSLNSGENLVFENGLIGNNYGMGLYVGAGNNINFNLVNTSLDNNHSWGVQNGAAASQNYITMTNCYIYTDPSNLGMWIQNYGNMLISGGYFNGGTNNATYSIDNQAQYSFTVVGAVIYYSGSGVALNPASMQSLWVGCVLTGTSGQLTGAGGVIAYDGSTLFKSLGVNGKLVTYNGYTVAGNGMATELFSTSLNNQQANYNGGTPVSIANTAVASIIRVAWSQFIQVAGSVSSTFPSLTLSWTDPSGVDRTKTLVSTSATNTTAVESDGVAVIQTKASTAVTVTSASYADGGGANKMTYTVNIVSELL